MPRKVRQENVAIIEEYKTSFKKHNHLDMKIFKIHKLNKHKIASNIFLLKTSYKKATFVFTKIVYNFYKM